jgi:hypothetical protein
MTDPKLPPAVDPDGPLDADDLAVLDRLSAIHAVVDPPPADLADLVTFALSLSTMDGEIARLTEEALIGTGARSGERTRTVTFDADSRTIMITIVERADGLVRLDGWLAPAAASRVELRLPEPDGSREVTADETGRFVFDNLVHGLAQLIVDPAEAGGPRVITPSLAL